MDGLLLLGSYTDDSASDDSDTDANRKEQSTVIRVGPQPVVEEPTKPKLPGPGEFLSQTPRPPSFVNPNFAAPALQELPTSRALKRPAPAVEAAESVTAAPVISEDISKELKAEEKRRIAAMKILAEEEERKKRAKMSGKDDKKETFHQKEKRKRESGQADRAKNYVEEEKRILREGGSGGAGFGFD